MIFYILCKIIPVSEFFMDISVVSCFFWFLPWDLIFLILWKFICVINLEPRLKVPPSKGDFHLFFPGGTNNLGSLQSRFQAWGYRSSSQYLVHTRAKPGLLLRVWLCGIPPYCGRGFSVQSFTMCSNFYLCPWSRGVSKTTVHIGQNQEMPSE